MSNYKVGLHNVGSYQVAGKPFAAGGLDATSANGLTLTFPMVTNWVTVTNNSGARLKMGFSHFGVMSASNWMDVPSGSTVGPLDLKLTGLFLSGGTAGQTSVIAGLTFINADSIDNANVSPGTPYVNWSGSAGVG